MSTKSKGTPSLRSKIDEYEIAIRLQFNLLQRKVDDLVKDRYPSHTTTGELARITEALADISGYNKCEARRAWEDGEI